MLQQHHQKLQFQLVFQYPIMELIRVSVVYRIIVKHTAPTVLSCHSHLNAIKKLILDIQEAVIQEIQEVSQVKETIKY